MLDSETSYRVNAADADGGSSMEIDIAEDVPVPESVDGGRPEPSDGQVPGANQTVEVSVQSEDQQRKTVPFQIQKQPREPRDARDDGSSVTLRRSEI